MWAIWAAGYAVGIVAGGALMWTAIDSEPERGLFTFFGALLWPVGLPLALSLLLGSGIRARVEIQAAEKKRQLAELNRDLRELERLEKLEMRRG